MTLACRGGGGGTDRGTGGLILPCLSHSSSLSFFPSSIPFAFPFSSSFPSLVLISWVSLLSGFSPFSPTTTTTIHHRSCTCIFGFRLSQWVVVAWAIDGDGRKAAMVWKKKKRRRINGERKVPWTGCFPCSMPAAPCCPMTSSLSYVKKTPTILVSLLCPNMAYSLPNLSSPYSPSVSYLL